MITRIQRCNLIALTVDYYEKKLGSLGSPIIKRNSPFTPTFLIHNRSQTRFESTSASRPVELAWERNVFKFTKALKEDEKPIHPLINAYRFFICICFGLNVRI